MKNFDAKKIRILFCPTAAMIAMIVVCFVFSYVLGIIMTVVCILSVILALLLFAKPEIAPAQMESPERAVIDEIDIPIVLVDNEGILRFCNAAFNGLFEDNQNNMGISGVIPELSLHWEVAADNIPIKDRRFSTKTREIISENTVLSMLTFIDCTELYDIKQKFTGENSVMIFLQIDNYDDLMSSTEHSYQGFVIAETGKVLGENFKILE